MEEEASDLLSHEQTYDDCCRSTMSGPLSLGRVTAALATVQNENSTSLATANIGFTLIEVTVPVEFNALGVMTSRKRKVDAEGVALFEGILPPTDDLFPGLW